MKNPLTIPALILAGIAVACRPTHAQGTVYLSGLDLATAGVVAIGSDARVETEFAAGTNAAGYLLNRVQISIGGITGRPAGLKVMLLNYVTRQPLLTLTGSDPTGDGVFMYEASGFVLLPGTSYWLALTSTTPLPTGAFLWNYTTATPAGRDGWEGGNMYAIVSPGPPPTTIRYVGRVPQFAVSATPIPEPASVALFILAGLVFVVRRHWAIPARPVGRP